MWTVIILRIHYRGQRASNNEAGMVGRLFKESVVQSFSNPTKRYRGTDTRECM